MQTCGCPRTSNNPTIYQVIILICGSGSQDCLGIPSDRVRHYLWVYLWVHGCDLSSRYATWYMNSFSNSQTPASTCLETDIHIFKQSLKSDLTWWLGHSTSLRLLSVPVTHSESDSLSDYHRNILWVSLNVDTSINHVHMSSVNFIHSMHLRWLLCSSHTCSTRMS